MAIGGALYIFLRPTAYVSLVIRKIKLVSILLEKVNFDSSNWLALFLNNWFCDFLWAYALAFCLLLVFEKAGKKYIMPIVISIGFSVLFEVLQGFEIISGTFDWLDLIMELTAIILAVIIKRRIHYEKP